jgi:hypothetical protein
LRKLTLGHVRKFSGQGRRVGDAMNFGLERSGSSKFIEGVASAHRFAFSFLDRAPEAVAVGAGFDDVCPIGDAIQQRLA